MSKCKALWIGLGIMALVLARGATRCAQTKDFVEGFVPMSVSELSAQIRNGALGEKFAEGSSLHLAGKPAEYPFLKYKTFSVGDIGPARTDDNLRKNSKDDAAMDRYLHLPAAARKEDIFLTNTTAGSYWYSEYKRFGRPLPFRCDFIVHLEEESPGQTRVEVLEYNPLVRLGRVPGWGHGGAPGFIADERLVPPTTSDRVEILERIETLASRRD